MTQPTRPDGQHNGHNGQHNGHQTDEQSVLIVEAASDVQSHLLAFLRVRGYSSVVATSVEEALEPLAHRSFQFTLLDVDTPDAIDFVPQLRAQRGNPGLIIGLVNGNGAGDDERVAPVIDAFVHKPLSEGELDATLAALMRPEPLAAAPVSTTPVPLRIRQEIALWRSPKMIAVREIIEEAAGVDVTVLITGETGTGKEVVANAVHYLSTRRDGPLVKVNCAAVPRELLESELFGHERGAFTGAHKLKIGKFESAHGGTIFLDEIGDLHSSLQAKLLHVLQDGDFSRVGGKATLKIDVRVIAATNQNLEQAVLEGRFREDLYYRLNVVQISVPPLRERTEEIPGLIEYFVQHYSKAFRRSGFSIPRNVVERLAQQRFRGNIRELENLVKRMIVLGDPLLTRTGPLLGAPMAAPAAPVAHTNGAPPAADSPIEVSLKHIARQASLAAEREAIRKVLEQTGWNRVRAAKALRISYRALLYKMKRVGLRDEALPRPAPFMPPGFASSDPAKGFMA